jgi:hypothetical protein
MRHGAAVGLDTHKMVERERADQKRTRRQRLKLAARIWIKWILLPAFLLSLGASFVCSPVKMQCRSMQSEAKSNLKGLLVEQWQFRDANGRYARDISELGWQPRGQKLRYRYLIEPGAADTFTAYAIGTEDNVAGDVWQMTDKNHLSTLTNACKR